MDKQDGSPGRLGRSPNRKPKVHVTGSFVRASTNSMPDSRKEKFKAFLGSYYVANFMVIVVLVDAYATCLDIDARAADAPPSTGWRVVSDVCLVLYSLEILSMLLVVGFVYLKDWMIVADVLIVLCGWAEQVIASVGGSSGIGFRVAVLRAMRLVRIFRIMRVLKRIRALRELHKLVMMMATCVRTLLWSFLLCFVVMTVWAMFMVELIHPTVKDMYLTQGFFDDCPQCRTAMSSVMNANLLLVKTVIAGDSWGEIAVPVIQKEPATGIIFIGSLLTLVFGVLNIIVAVVVDTFADARQNDLQNLAEEMEDEIEHDRRELAKLFAKIDKDNSGQLTLQELIEGARSDPQFQSRLRVMDIDENDLHQLFTMIDSDQSGTIEVSEFIGPLSRWAHDSKTAPRFIKYNMLQTMHLQEDLYALSEDCFRQLAMRVNDLSLQVSELAMAIPGSPGSLPSRQGTKTIPMPNRLSRRLSQKTHGIHSHDKQFHPPNLEVVPDGSDMPSSILSMWTRQNTEMTEQLAPMSPTESLKGNETDEVDQPHASLKPKLKADADQSPNDHVESLEKLLEISLETLLKASVARLEAKLDLLLDRSKFKDIRHDGLGTGSMQMSAVSSLNRKKGPKGGHVDTFRSFYMGRRQRISLDLGRRSQEQRHAGDASVIQTKSLNLGHRPHRQISAGDASVIETRSLNLNHQPLASAASSGEDPEKTSPLMQIPNTELAKNL